MCALAYLARANQPVAPVGLVLVAAAAGGLSDHGLGRLLSTPGLDTLAAIVDHAPRHAAEQALRALVKPVCAALARHGGYDTADRTTLAAAVADALHTTPWTTAVGFLRALRNLRPLRDPATNHRGHHRNQWRRRRLTPPAHARELARHHPERTPHPTEPQPATCCCTKRRELSPTPSTAPPTPHCPSPQAPETHLEISHDHRHHRDTARCQSIN